MTTVRNWDKTGDLALAMLAHLEERYRAAKPRSSQSHTRHQTP